MIEINVRADHGKPTTFKQFRTASAAETFLRQWMPQNVAAIDYNQEIERIKANGCSYITTRRNGPTAFVSWDK